MAHYPMGVLPWFTPGVVLSMAIAAFVCRPFGKALGVRPSLAWAILVGFGVVVSATLTPLRGIVDFEPVVAGVCDLSRIGPAPIRELLRLNDTSLNVVLFVPLGIAIGLISAWRPRAALIVAAIALPFAIETIQLLVPLLERGCQSADVVDNLTGLIVALALGTGLGCSGARSIGS